MAHQLHDAKEKLSYYRRCAAEAGRSAGTALDADMGAAYFAIQRTWIYLAEELEREVASAAGSMIISDDDVFVPGATDRPSHKAR